MAWWTAFLLGLVGSLHCLGMCGPLALALPAARRHGADFVAGRVLYNGGRILTYGALGILFGLIGQTLVLAGLQQALSLLAGAFILGYLLLRRRPVFAVTGTGLVARAVGRLKTSLGGLLKRHSKRALFGIGLLNGLLPCGLVYVALAAAAATGSALGGMEYMVWFGIGTAPMMLGVSLFGKFVQGSLQRHFQRLVPVALGVMAVLFLLRGMALGIPYISPDLHAGPGMAGCCH
jgi:hypothetical protein